MITYPAALDLPHALVEAVTMLIVLCECVGTAHAYVRSVVTLLARRAPGLTQGLREAKARAQYILVDGTLAE